VDKASVVNREKQLIVTLDAALAKIGYHVVVRRDGTRVATNAQPTAPRRRRRRRLSAAARQAASRRMKAYWVKRRAQAAPKPRAKRRGRRVGQAAS
jgi:hypothetical protein